MTNLMMDVVVVCIVSTEHLERVEWEAVSAVVIDRLARAEREQEQGLPDSHSRQVLCQSRTKGVKDETFERVVVESAIGIWHVKFMMNHMQLPVKELVGVHPTVEEVLPCIEDKAMNKA